MDRAQQKLALNKKIEDTTKSLKQKAEEYKDLGKNALLIGGVMVLAYSIFRLFDDDEEEENDKTKETKNSLLSTGLKGIASSVLLAIAKEKLMEYIESLDKNEK